MGESAPSAVEDDLAKRVLGLAAKLGSDRDKAQKKAQRLLKIGAKVDASIWMGHASLLDDVQAKLRNAVSDTEKGRTS